MSNFSHSSFLGFPQISDDEQNQKLNLTDSPQLMIPTPISPLHHQNQQLNLTNSPSFMIPTPISPIYHQNQQLNLTNPPSFMMPTPLSQIPRTNGPRFGYPLSVGSPSAAVAAATRGPKKRPRGRPSLPNNKPKSISVKPIILKIPKGIDIMQTISQFALKRELDVSVMAGYGIISDFDIYYPGSYAPPMKLSGTFRLQSFVGNFSSCAPSSLQATGCFIVSASNLAGVIFSGVVASKMIAASEVVLVATLSRNKNVYKVPGDPNMFLQANVNVGGQIGNF